jgi:hypothetical protein
MESIESKSKPEHTECQPAALRRLTRAAAHVAEARLLVLQERRHTLGANKARSLGVVADALAIIISPLELIGRSRATDFSTTVEFPVALAQSLSCAAKDNLPVQGGVQ